MESDIDRIPQLDAAEQRDARLKKAGGAKRRRRSAAKDRAAIAARGGSQRPTLSEAQRAKLRHMARTVFDFEMQTRARSAVIDTARQFISACYREMQRLEPNIAIARRDLSKASVLDDPHAEGYANVLEELQATQRRLETDIADSQKQIASVVEEGNAAAAIAQPLRDTIQRVLQHCNLTAASLGIDFQLIEDGRRTGDIVVTR